MKMCVIKQLEHIIVAVTLFWWHKTYGIEFY